MPLERRFSGRDCDGSNYRCFRFPMQSWQESDKSQGFGDRVPDRDAPAAQLSPHHKRIPFATKSVTYVLGTICYPCVRSGQKGFWYAREDSNL